MTDADLCVSCGDVVPEGVMVCPACRREPDPWFEPDPPKFCKVCGRKATVIHCDLVRQIVHGCDNCIDSVDVLIAEDWMVDIGADGEY